MRPSTILVCEDEPALGEVVRDFFTASDVDCVLCQSADRAMRALAEDENISLLLTDYYLPGNMNGVQLARAAQLHRPGLRIVIMSGDTRAVVSENEALAQLDPEPVILQKPFSLSELIDKVL